MSTHAQIYVCDVRISAYFGTYVLELSTSIRTVKGLVEAMTKIPKLRTRLDLWWAGRPLSDEHTLGQNQIPNGAMINMGNPNASGPDTLIHLNILDDSLHKQLILRANHSATINLLKKVIQGTFPGYYGDRLDDIGIFPISPGEASWRALGWPVIRFQFPGASTLKELRLHSGAIRAKKINHQPGDDF